MTMAGADGVTRAEGWGGAAAPNLRTKLSAEPSPADHQLLPTQLRLQEGTERTKPLSKKSKKPDTQEAKKPRSPKTQKPKTQAANRNKAEVKYMMNMTDMLKVVENDD